MHRRPRVHGGARPDRPGRAPAHRRAGRPARHRPAGGGWDRGLADRGRSAGRGPSPRPPDDVRRAPGSSCARWVAGPVGGSRAGQGIAGGPAGAGRRRAGTFPGRPAEAGRGMTPILVAGATGLFATLLGTPLAIRLFRTWGWGQRIREDGPEGHLEKMGTPTMGGIVIIAGMALAYAVARVRTPFTRAGLAVLGVALGLAVVGA